MPTAPRPKPLTSHRGGATVPRTTAKPSRTATARKTPKKKPAAAAVKPDTTPAPVRGPRPGSAMAAAIEVLTAAGPGVAMTPQAIYDEAAKRGLVAGLNGKTPVATLQAQLAVANKAGRHVTRPEPGKYAMRPAA